MTPTSEERREVAERLRCEEIARNSEEAYVVLLSCIGIRPQLPAVRTYKDAMARMADLIDPTCHIVRVDDTYNTPETGRVDEWHYKCSKCGIELDDNDTDAMDSGVKPFDYCPNCGARVVRE